MEWSPNDIFMDKAVKIKFTYHKPYAYDFYFCVLIGEEEETWLA